MISPRNCYLVLVLLGLVSTALQSSVLQSRSNQSSLYYRQVILDGSPMPLHIVIDAPSKRLVSSSLTGSLRLTLVKTQKHPALPSFTAQLFDLSHEDLFPLPIETQHTLGDQVAFQLPDDLLSRVLNHDTAQLLVETTVHCGNSVGTCGYVQLPELVIRDGEGETRKRRSVEMEEYKRPPKHRRRHSGRRRRGKKDRRKKKPYWKNKKWQRAQFMKTLCQRRPFYFDFHQMDWDSWVVAPAGYNAYYCSGRCPHAWASRLGHTNHALVQSMLSSIRPKEVPSSCCVPTKLDSLTMLAELNGRLKMKIYQDMIARECGCR